MSKFSSFKEQQLITEGWRNFLVEQQPVAQQAPAQQQAKMQVNQPNSIIAALQKYAKNPKGSPGPDKTTINNLNTNGKEIIANLASNTKKAPLQAAQLVLQTYAQLSEEDKAEIAELTLKILNAGKNIKQPVKEQKNIISNLSDFSWQAVTALGSGDVAKGLKIMGGTAFAVTLAMAIADIASGEMVKGGASLLSTLAQKIPQTLKSGNLSDLTNITNDLVGGIATPAPKRDDAIDESKTIYHGAHLDDGTLVCEACLQELLESQRTIIQEAKYQGKTVTLNKPMKGDVKKSKVYVRDPQTGNIKKVNFGDKNMKIKKNIPARRKSFRARHNCDNPGPKTKARYWSCKAW